MERTHPDGRASRRRFPRLILAALGSGQGFYDADGASTHGSPVIWTIHAPCTAPTTPRLVDKSAYAPEDLAALDSPVADLFRIEKSRDWSEVRVSVRRLHQSLGPAEDALRQAFGTWLKKMVLPRLGLPQEEISAAETLEEVDTMLTESIDRWNRELREKALQEGRQEEGARIVRQLLRLKFGPLDPATEERIRSADAERLVQWSERILTAERLGDVFLD